MLKNIYNKIINRISNDLKNSILDAKKKENEKKINDIYFKINSIEEIIDIVNQTLYSMENDKSLILRVLNESPIIKEINNKTFEKYRSVYKGRDVAVFGSGPTLNYYEPLEETINIGVNTTFLNKNIKFDYIFAQDSYWLNKTNLKLIDEYPCKKIFSFNSNNASWSLPFNLKELNNVEEYYRNILDSWNSIIYYDICKAPLATFGSVIFPAVHFALWTYPRRIYLVGCDCTCFSKGHFDGTINTKRTISEKGDEKYIIGWNKIKKFQEIYYPDIEMIWINPVGVKGIFKDIFTKNYITETHKNSFVNLNGYYENGWLEKSSSFCILTGNSGEIAITGYYPNEITGKLTGKICINDEEKPVSITENNFNFVFQVKPDTVTYINIEMDFEFDAQSPDKRKLCFVLTGITSK